MKEEVRRWLWDHQDPAYRRFQQKLIPTVPPETIIGVRTPALRNYARELSVSPAAPAYFEDLPHGYFEENQLHAFRISREKDFERCLCALRLFLPYVDNWATCDQMTPAVFRRHRPQLLPVLQEWLSSPGVYARRFAIKQLMDHFLTDSFDPAFPEMVAAVPEEDPYLQKMKAWYFAAALCKQPEPVLALLREQSLSDEVHRMTIQKAVESFRISPEQKEVLRSLRRTQIRKEPPL